MPEQNPSRWDEAVRGRVTALVRDALVDLLQYDPEVQAALCRALHRCVVEEVSSDPELLEVIGRRVADALFANMEFSRKVARCLEVDDSASRPAAG